MRPIYTLSIFLATLTGIAAPGQKRSPDEEAHASLVTGKKRAVIAYAGKDRSFTMDVNAKTAKASDIPGFVSIDGQIVQATLVPSSSSIDARQMTTAQEKETLTKYMNYELAYYKKKLKQNYSQLQTEWITIKDRLFLVWYFDMPKDYKLVSRQLYFSTLLADQVLDLNAPVFKTDQFSHARSVVNRLVNSLKTYDKYLDVEGLKKELSK
ncbi:MAG: hypothetical protein J0H74_26925 [Chitinophagaceae bacterium]|nr:hypothetical protein [Chitinophagaceae bacterium]